MAPTGSGAKPKAKAGGEKGKGKKGKAGGKGKKEGDAGEEDPLTPEEKNVLLQRQLEATRLHLQRETERANEAVRGSHEARDLMLQMESDFGKERRLCQDMAADMTRQYKAMRDELMERVHKLKDEITELRDGLEMERMRTAEVERVKDQELALKDAKIAELTATMDEMAFEFGQMLKQTLSKMSEKIVITNEWGPNEGKDQPVVTTFEHFDLGLSS